MISPSNSSLKSAGTEPFNILFVFGSKNTGIGNNASSSVPVINFDTVLNITPCWNILPPFEFLIPSIRDA